LTPIQMFRARLYIADTDNRRIRKVTANGTIVTVAVTGRHGFSGDGGPATRAALGDPRAVAVRSDGTLIIADTRNQRIRHVTPDGVISTIAGGRAVPAGSGVRDVRQRGRIDVDVLLA